MPSVTYTRGSRGLHASDDIAHLAGKQPPCRAWLRDKQAQLLDIVGLPRGGGRHTVALLHLPVHNLHKADDAAVLVVKGVEEEHAERLAGLAAGWRHTPHYLRQQLIQAKARLGRDQLYLVGGDVKQRLHLLRNAIWLGCGQVNLVNDRHYGQVLLKREVKVGHCLRLHALHRVHKQQRALAGRQRAADLVAEVDVPRRVNQVEEERQPVVVVHQARCLRLHGDTPLPLHLQLVQVLRLPPLGYGSCQLH
mmetsp:Transcript_13219/g.33957  ORF Transcript_13219/g.33957 Transcript_13219/m.33957 type:complete len:250 (+) Transcript_13219:1222-1971(+)